MNALAILLAVLSIWDYPLRYPAHEQLRAQFISALREGDTLTMEETSRKGVKLLPDDPTWHYNLACSLAYFPNRSEEAFDELELAIDLGFRDDQTIAADNDLKRLKSKPRYRELLEYAKFMRLRPIISGPLAVVPATGVFGRSISLGEQNLRWDFDAGCFSALLNLAVGSAGGNVGDLYMNRDAGHSRIRVSDFPGLTEVSFDREGRDRKMDLNIPNVVFPYPTFGNASMAFVGTAYWRSIPRAIMTTQAISLKTMVKMYRSNQIWAFPSHMDTPPVGTNGDVFASITPYWITTAGRSFSDRPYLSAALTASRSMNPQVKRAVVANGMLTPVITTLIRKSLAGVKTEEDYLSPAAHPTAFPPGAVDTNRVRRAAAALTIEKIAPLVQIGVSAMPVKAKSIHAELTYATAHAWAFVLRSDDDVREFVIRASGAEEYAFVQTHGTGVKAVIERIRPDAAKVTIAKKHLSPTNRIDITVVGRNGATGWGAPSYVSFARMDPSAPYSDPALTVLSEPKSK